MVLVISLWGSRSRKLLMKQDCVGAGKSAGLQVSGGKLCLVLAYLSGTFISSELLLIHVGSFRDANLAGKTPFLKQDH